MKLFLGVVFLLVFISSNAHAESVCDTFKRFEAETNKDTPRKVDFATELIQVRVNCELKIINYVKRLLVDSDKFKSGWRERKQRQHHQLHCNKDGLASNMGWTARDTLYNSNYTLAQELETTPHDCKNAYK